MEGCIISLDNHNLSCIKKGFGMHLVVAHKGGCPSPHIVRMLPISPYFGIIANQMMPWPTIQSTWYTNSLARII